MLSHSDEPGDLRYRLIEYQRMPVMALLAVDDPRALSREEWVRLGFAGMLHPNETLPVNEPGVIEFEKRFCQDRFWTDSEAGPNTRFICTGNTFTVVGDAAFPFFIDGERGVLARAPAPGEMAQSRMSASVPTSTGRPSAMPLTPLPAVF